MTDTTEIRIGEYKIWSDEQGVWVGDGVEGALVNDEFDPEIILGQVQDAQMAVQNIARTLIDGADDADYSDYSVCRECGAQRMFQQHTEQAMKEPTEPCQPSKLTCTPCNLRQGCEKYGAEQANMVAAVFRK